MAVTNKIRTPVITLKMFIKRANIIFFMTIDFSDIRII